MVSRASRVVVSAVPQMDGWMDYLDETLGRTAPFAVVRRPSWLKRPARRWRCGARSRACTR